MTSRRSTPPGRTGFLSREGSPALPLGSLVEPGRVRGYHLDFSSKSPEPDWPPDWLGDRRQRFYIDLIQWGLGCYERFLHGEGERWLAAAEAAGGQLLADQDEDGGWPQLSPMPHTYVLEPPWLSAMAQGEGASLLVRLGRELGEERFTDAALRALRPLALPVERGGVRADLGSGPFLEEYPTRPGSYVLNGAILAMFGYHDVGAALGDAEAERSFRECAAALAANIDRWDTGWWSLYDLYPHPVPNVASGFYHALHITLLEALELLAPHPELPAAAERFRGYRASRSNRARALAQKAALRLLVPRNRALAQRAAGRVARRQGRGRRPARTIILCYHAVSPAWLAALSITPEAFSEQIEHLQRRGYRGVTFHEAVYGSGAGKRVAITFDDGYASVGERAAPVLAGVGWPATVFVVTDFVERGERLAWPGVEEWLGSEHAGELEPLGWEELAALRDGGWEVGSHTATHPRLTETDEAGLARELGQSRRLCEERLGTACASISYPYGAVDERVVVAARAAGYAAGAALPARFGRPRPLEWPRTGIYHGDSIRDFRLKLSPAIRTLRSSSAWEPLVAIRGRAGGRRDPS